MKLLNKNLGFLIILIVGIIPLFALFQDGLPITHDGKDHVARIANFYIALQEGVIVPRWGALLNWGYGHPVMMFLYPFSSYASSLFHFLGFSFTDSVKIVFGLGFISSGVAMYLWARNAFNEYVGIAAGILYMYAPYRFVDLYVRGAIGEHTAFIFPPLVLYFLYKFFQKKNKVRNQTLYFLGIAFSMASLLLSHNAISIMFLPMIIFYSLYLSYQVKDFKKLIYAISGLIAGFMLSSFFLLPAFLEGKYTLRDIVTGNEYRDRFVEPFRFLWGEWSYGITGYFTVQLGIIQWIGIILFPFIVFWDIRKERKHLYLLAAIFFFLLTSLFLQIESSNFIYETVTTLKKFQFPWRFLSLTVFSTAILSASVFLIIKDSYKKIVLAILIVIAVLINWNYMGANGYFKKNDNFYTSIYPSTTDTGESSPIWSVRFMEVVPEKRVEILDGNGQVVEISRSTTKHSYKINALENIRVKDNTIFFPGWKVYADGKQIPIEFQDPSQRGLITFDLDKGEHYVDVVFEDTKLRTVANLISIAAAFVLFAMTIYLFKKYEDK